MTDIAEIESFVTWSKGQRYWIQLDSLVEDKKWVLIEVLDAISTHRTNTGFMVLARPIGVTDIDGIGDLKESQRLTRTDHGKCPLIYVIFSINQKRTRTNVPFSEQSVHDDELQAPHASESRKHTKNQRTKGVHVFMFPVVYQSDLLQTNADFRKPPHNIESIKHVRVFTKNHGPSSHSYISTRLSDLGPVSVVDNRELHRELD